MRRRWKRTAVAAVVVGLIGANGVAFVQAWAMTHFVPAGRRTDAPERLSTLAKLGVLVTGVRVPRPTSACRSRSLAWPAPTG